MISADVEVEVDIGIGIVVVLRMSSRKTFTFSPSLVMTESLCPRTFLFAGAGAAVGNQRDLKLS